jgi:hypothetical protein
MEKKVGGVARAVGAWIWVGFASILLIGCMVSGWWAGVLFFAVSIAAALPPLKAHLLPTISGAARVAASAVAGFLGFIVIGERAPTVDPATEPKATASSSATPSPAAVDPKAVAEARSRAFHTLYDKVIRIAKPCDEANSNAAETLQEVSRGRATVFDAYGVAKAAEEQCSAVSAAMASIDVPDEIEGDAEDKVEEAVSKCRNAYTMRAMSLQTMLEVIDGDAKPSKVQEYRERAEAGQGGVLLCVASLFEAASSAGVELKPSEK